MDGSLLRSTLPRRYAVAGPGSPPQRSLSHPGDCGQNLGKHRFTLVPRLGEEDSRPCRNKFIAARMYATDIRFSQFEEKLFRQTRESEFAATLATLGLTSAAAFSSGGASQVLSGVAAFIIGGREAFQKEVLAERTVIAIHTAMRARRAQVRLRLREGLRQSVEQYPVAAALADLNDYYDAGTILGALIGITETVGAEAKQKRSILSTKGSVMRELQRRFSRLG
jgi:hypothetical protein